MSKYPIGVTRDSVEEVEEVLRSRNIPFTFEAEGHCFIISNPEKHRRFQYFYTTGRWSRILRGRKNTTHYWSDGIHDFLDNFFNRTFESTKETHDKKTC